jgi:hypothetical protein
MFETYHVTTAWTTTQRTGALGTELEALEHQGEGTTRSGSELVAAWWVERCAIWVGCS